MFKRKVLTAVISSLVFAVVFSLGNDFSWNGFFNLYYLNFMFVVTYGVLMSSISEWAGNKYFKKTSTREMMVFILHCAFGSILNVLGLVSAILFYIVDRLLQKVKVTWLTVAIGLVIVVITFIILLI